MIILDTNVISELFRPEPTARVVSWLAAQTSTEIYLTSITEAELRFGIALLPAGRRRAALAEAVDGMISEEFYGRILAFDSAAARAYAGIAKQRRGAGRPVSVMDCQIAAMAQAHGASLATRNVSDFAGCGIRVIDPWSAP